MSASRTLSAETIDVVYRLLLGRLPESESLVQSFVEHCDFKDMRNIIVGSPEFIECALKKTRGTDIDFFDALHIDELSAIMRCLEHLTTLNLPLFGKRIAIVGSGLGLMASYFIERRCSVDLFDASPQLVDLSKIYIGSTSDERMTRNIRFNVTDFDAPELSISKKFDAAICYNVLWQSRSISDFLNNLAEITDKILVLETRVAYGDQEDLLVMVDREVSSQDGLPVFRNIPTRKWMWSALKKHFPFVYAPHTQPCHRSFPSGWKRSSNGRSNFGRAIFIASRAQLDLDTLDPQLVVNHTRATSSPHE